MISTSVQGHLEGEQPTELGLSPLLDGRPFSRLPSAAALQFARAALRRRPVPACLPLALPGLLRSRLLLLRRLPVPLNAWEGAAAPPLPSAAGALLRPRLDHGLNEAEGGGPARRLAMIDEAEGKAASGPAQWSARSEATRGRASLLVA